MKHIPALFKWLAAVLGLTLLHTASAAATKATEKKAAEKKAVEVKAPERFGDWAIECPTFGDKKVCLLEQTVVTPKEKRRLVKFSVHKEAVATDSTVTVLLPLGIYLPPGATLSFAVDEKDSLHDLPLTVQTCTPQGCIANTKLDFAQLKKIGATGKLTVSFSPRPDGKPVTVNGSPKGLADGIAALHD